MVLEVLLQCNASSHNRCEFHVVHHVRAGVSCEIFFHGFLSDPTNTSRKASYCSGVGNAFHELVVRRGVVYIYI